jgi:hypothetical protein
MLCFQNGKPISPKRRCNIIDAIKFKGGNKDTGITAIRDFTTIRDFKLIRYYKSTKLPMKIPVSLLPPLNLIASIILHLLFGEMSNGLYCLSATLL